jgi:hypothetical protein
MAADPGPSLRPELPYRLAWLVPSAEWIEAVSIAPSGDVVAFGARMLRVHARETGRMLTETATCPAVPNGFGFVGPSDGALVCEDRIDALTFPGAASRRARKLPGKASAAAFGAGVVAVADEQGAVRLFDPRTWRERKTIAAAGAVTTLALSRDGALLGVGLGDGRVRIHRGASAEPIEIEARLGHAVRVLAFSPSGELLFGSAGPLVAVWRTADGGLVRAFRMVREVGVARWLSEQDVAVTGPDGLLVLFVGDGSARSIGDGSDAGSAPPVALDASNDGRVLCLGAPATSVRCFVRGVDRTVEVH